MGSNDTLEGKEMREERNTSHNLKTITKEDTRNL